MRSIKSVNFWLQFLLWLLFWGIVFFHNIEWLPTVGIFYTKEVIALYSLFYIFLLAVFPYINSVFLVPLYFKKGKYLIFFSLFLIGVASSLISFVGLDCLFTSQPFPFWFFIPIHFLSRLPYVLMFTLVAHLFKIRSDFYKKAAQQLVLEKSKIEAELQALKAQINPHFLFNTLNNIQSLAFTDPQRASDSIVDLSKLFRYVSYDGKRNKVMISEERKHIENYLKLAVMKKTWQHKVTFSCKNEKDQEIEPLLFINFIENAFKHGSLEEENDFIKIELKSNQKYIQFSCSNTISNNEVEGGSIGLCNVLQRLELIYKNQYVLENKIENNIYHVDLKISL
jgi:sensor histidine kinase YesM